MTQVTVPAVAESQFAAMVPATKKMWKPGALAWLLLEGQSLAAEVVPA